MLHALQRWPHLILITAPFEVDTNISLTLQMRKWELRFSSLIWRERIRGLSPGPHSLPPVSRQLPHGWRPLTGSVYVSTLEQTAGWTHVGSWSERPMRGPAQSLMRNVSEVVAGHPSSVQEERLACHEGPSLPLQKPKWSRTTGV